MSVEADVLHKAFENPLCKEIAVFLEKNPSTVDTVTGIAMRLGRDKKAIGAAVRTMVEVGVIQNWGAVWGSPGYVEDADVYTYTRDPAVRTMVHELVGE